jgi:hypothetical protein
MMRARLLVCLLLVPFCFCPLSALAGGPLIVGGPAVENRPAFGVDGQPFTWDPAKMPIQYRVDPGPMAIAPGGTVVISNATGLDRLKAVFGVWQAVPTAAISYSNAGPLLPAGSYTGGDLTTVQQYNDIVGSCKSATQSPVIFDADGQIMSGLGLPPEVIGLTSGCALDATNGHLLSALIVMNGKFQDGVTSTSSPRNYELPANVFDEAITHEIGHFSGLDHSQINLDLLTNHTYPCDIDGLAGLPLMFPVAMCQARKDAGLPTLAPDDVAWISRLYPSAQYVNSYGTISGTIFFSDDVSQVQGANVIARMVDDPATPEDESRRVAVSVVSGYLFTGNPGQSVTASMPDAHENNTYGDPDGSRNPQLRGYYEIPVPPGTYTIEVESIYSSFVGGSSVGVLSPPIPIPGPPEFWNKDESAFDYPLQRDTITVHAGEKVTGIDIILNNTAPTFDGNEDSGALWDPPLARPFGVGREVMA